MKVSEWALHHHGDIARLTLSMQWEDRDHAPDELWFEWPAEHADLMSATADAALLATYPLAMWFGERRLALAGTVCPRLADGTRAAMALVSHRREELRTPTLEVQQRVLDDGVMRRSRAAALCLSGGVDALSAFRENLLTTPEGHPARIQVAPFVFGLNTYDFDPADQAPRADRMRGYRAQLDRLTHLTSPHAVDVIPVATNLRALFPSFEAWGAVAHANNAPLAAVAHAMRGHIRSLAIASSGSTYAAELLRHEAVNAFHSSTAVDVHVVQLMERRIDKLRRIVAWPEALELLRVCLLIDLPTDGQINCGHCEKCVRTMLMLLIIGDGALERAPFPNDVTAEAIDRVVIDSAQARKYYLELSPALRSIGRDDLAAAIDRGLARAPATRQPEDSGGRPWWKRIRR